MRPAKAREPSRFENVDAGQDSCPVDTVHKGDGSRATEVKQISTRLRWQPVVTADHDDGGEDCGETAGAQTTMRQHLVSLRGDLSDSRSRADDSIYTDPATASQAGLPGGPRCMIVSVLSEPLWPPCSSSDRPVSPEPRWLA